MRTLINLVKAMISLVFIGGLAGFSPALSPTTTINVTIFTDEYSAEPSTGCSLREAIQAANTDMGFGGCPAGSGTDTITIPAGTYIFSRSGADDTNVNGDLDISSNINLSGVGMDQSIIDANHLSRAISIINSSTVTISNLTLTQGISEAGGIGDGMGGGLLNYHGSTNLLYVKISNNQSAPGKGCGGIRNELGTMHIDYSIVTDNVAGDSSGTSDRTDGGGICNSSSAIMTIDHSVIKNNYAGDRGGGTKTMDYAGFGGGIYNAGDLTIDHSLIWNNRAGDNLNFGTLKPGVCIAGGYGGGIANSGDIEMNNSTIYGNSAGYGAANVEYCSFGGSGGGYMGQNGTATMNNVTLTGNNNGDGIEDDGITGGVYLEYSSLSIHNVILFGNELNNCYHFLGSLISQDYNLYNNIGCPISGTITHNISADPLLLPLLNNWGVTQTLALPAGSPAIDAGDPASCPTTDQRGFHRPVDGDAVLGAVCDIGAYEYGYTPFFLPLIKK